MLRVRFAPSPTGYLHIGSARTFIFNWLYARHNGGTMILRIDDTDVERNTEASLDSIFDGLQWLDLGWDEQYRQSERLDLHRQTGRDDLRARASRIAISRPPAADEGDKPRGEGAWLFNPGMRELSARGERPPRRRRRAVRAALPRAARAGAQRSAFTTRSTASNRNPPPISRTSRCCAATALPTYHLASCADDADLRISHIIRGQDHLTNTFKHVLIFEAAGAAAARSSRTCRC